MIEGDRLRAIRKKRKLTAEQLAVLVGITRQQIVRYESGGAGMNTETLKKIAHVLQVSADYLLGLSDSYYPDAKPTALSWRLDTTLLLDRYPPNKVAQVVKAFGIKVVPNPLVIDEIALLDRYPPALVARFINELGLKPELAEPEDTPPPQSEN